MPGAMRKMGVYLGLVEDDLDRADGGWSETQERPAERTRERGSRGEAYPAAHAGPPHGAVATATREAPFREPPAREYYAAEPEAAAFEEYPAYAEVEYPSYRITTLHPRTYNEARTIGEHFRNGTPVIMNLSEMEDADAKRLVDFAAGLTFGLHGRLERVTNKVFLLSPHNVTVTAQDKARIAEGGFFNQS